MRKEEAKRIAEAAKFEGLNYQINFILAKIREAAEIGSLYIVLDYSRINLYEKDYEWFEKQGYEVKRPVDKILIPFGSESKKQEHQVMREFGIISWK